MTDIAVTFISILAKVLFFAILIRALMSWFVPQDSSGISRVLSDITEPILRPIRRVLPSLGGMDFSPWIAMILITFVSQIIVSLIQSSSA